MKGKLAKGRSNSGSSLLCDGFFREKQLNERDCKGTLLSKGLFQGTFSLSEISSPLYGLWGLNALHIRLLADIGKAALGGKRLVDPLVSLRLFLFGFLCCWLIRMNEHAERGKQTAKYF